MANAHEDIRQGRMDGSQATALLLVARSNMSSSKELEICQKQQKKDRHLPVENPGGKRMKPDI